MQSAEPLVDGIAFPEGLAWSPDTGTMLCTGVQEAAVYEIWPAEHRKQRLADLGGGGANNVALASRGGAVVCQNGGVDANPSRAARYPKLPRLPEIATARPGLMYLSPGRELTYLVDAGLNAPNDITVAANGDLVFTDPGNPFLEPRADPRLMCWSQGAGLSQIADGFAYCNGIFADGESLLVTDHGGVMRFSPDGSREWVIRYDDGNVDGVSMDTEGRIYVARQGRACVDVVQDGRVVELLALPEPALITNVCFGGPDRSWAFVTDALSGSVSVFHDLPARGAPVADWDPSRPGARA